MPPARAPATPEERAAKIAKLPPWAREYIGQLENLTRTLAAQLQQAQDAHAQITEIADHAREELRLYNAAEDAPTRFGDFFTVHHLPAGLIVNTDAPMTLHPTSPDYILITRAG